MVEALSRANFDRDVGRIDLRSARALGWTVLAAAYPTLDVLFAHATAAPLRLRFTCDDWDELPPAIELLDAAGAHLVQRPPCHSSQFHPGPHPATGRPFVCMRGAREYHTFPGHLTDLWDNYRGQPGMDLGGIAHQLWRVWRRAAG